MTDDDIRDFFAGLGPAAIKRMFGGKGVYYGGLIIAVEIRGELMLKGDEISAPDFEAAGASRWTYVASRHGKTVSMPYWTVPDEAVDDPDTFAIWASKAYEAAKRTQK